MKLTVKLDSAYSAIKISEFKDTTLGAPYYRLATADSERTTL